MNNFSHSKRKIFQFPRQVRAFNQELQFLFSMEVEDAKFYLRKRYLVAFLVFIGWALMYLMRLNLSICIVDMTSSHSVTIDNETWVEVSRAFSHQN